MRREVEAEAKVELRHREKQLEVQFAVKLDRELEKRKGTLERETGQLRTQLRSSQKAVEKQRRMLESRQGLVERQLDKARKELEKRAANMDREAERKAVELAKKEKARSEAEIERERLGFDKQKLEWQRKQNALEKQVGDLKRKVEEETAYALQEYSEDSLCADLRDAFKEDDIRRLPRGKSVGDVQHRVIYRGEEIGLIIYDVKNVKSWQNAFVDQAKKYRAVHNTPHVVLVSTAFPGKEKNLAVKNGVLIVSPEHAVLVAGLLREGLVAMAKAMLSAEERGVKVAQLYAYLTSNDYRQKAEAIVDGVQKLRDLQGKEIESHRRNWKQQEQQHKRIDDGIGEVRAHVEAIIESETPGVTVSVSRKKKTQPVEEIVATP